ncbi:HAMP domain-containing sensor histidine kinase [Streptomyces sp. NBS 14/10]|uniref:sensor histidine kinase n=1 Tax=Streptomyces sp. NBS 14/10 TaxID=1945643 RepID=UPI000B7D7362|nr:HAMP domain-containing sensor histidine kinase [Streptomyces sp. NBS 14/10]KAK1182778.1 HAMP domain-containing sensor histidine kinase [Streptomyces sp. NBS 14/10]
MPVHTSAAVRGLAPAALRRLTARIVCAGLPRRTVRLRLTALYGGLFLVSGAALLAVTYGLVAGAVDRPPTVLKREVTVASPSPSASAGRAQGGNEGTRPGGGPGDRAAMDTAMAALQKDVQRTVDHQKSAMLHTLLVQSGIALGLMSLTSVLLGWVVAGRVLRPLRTITSTAQDISATSLHRRLALAGPRDELRELGDTFDALLARLDGAFQAQRQFVANASHELRTPLARQRVLGQVALADPEPTVESLRTAHERILAAGQQQERLIEALLTLARGHAGLDERRPFDLARLAREAVAARATAAHERQVALRPQADAAVSSGHRALAERLVANLLDNAIRYNMPGGQVDITTGTQAGRAVLTVANTGPDVPADAVERILLPFQRLGPARTGSGGRGASSQGFGLGLSIVSAIASAHDATLTAAPRPGGGLVVTVRFPAAATQPP